MLGAAHEAALLKGTLPAGDRPQRNAAALLFPPLAHVGDVVQATVGHCLHPLALAASPAVHAGGDL